MGFWSDLFGSGSGANPYKAAAPWMGQVPGTIDQYYNPYIQMGDVGRGQMGELAEDYRGMLGGLDSGLGDELTGQYRQMAQDPAAYQQQLGAGFQADPGYQWDRDQQLQAQNQAMAAGGMSGSPQSQQFAQQLASHLADQQYGNYMNRQFGISGAGLQGLGGQQDVGLGMAYKGLQGLGDIASQNLQYGYGGSTQAQQGMSDYLYNRANLAAGQAQDKRNRSQGLLGGALGLFSKPLSALGSAIGL